MRRVVLMAGLLLLLVPPSFSQDTSWTQAMEAWVDGVYYPNFFLGGNYITKVSLADIDADGDLDMFYGGGDSGSLVYFENVGSPQSPRFELRYEEFPGLRLPGRLTGIADADFADLDGDGDLDAIVSRDVGGPCYLFWNDGTSQQPVFGRRGPAPTGIQSNATIIDIDADGDLDCFSGAGYRGFQLEYAENTGSDTLPNFVVRSRNYQGLDFGVPFNFDMGDLDSDGDFDLLVCEFPGPVAFYQNTGSPDSAYFTLISDNFLPDRDTTDWMETPEFADIDADGDLDLFLAGGYAHLYYFENIGSPQEADFVQRNDTSYFYNVRGQQSMWLSNAVDIDGDGLQDFCSGRAFFINEGSPGEPRFARFDGLGAATHGAYADLDADGDFDCLTGLYSPSVGLVENVGTRDWPSWGAWRELFSDPRMSEVNSVAPGDLDADGDIDLLLGTVEAPAAVYLRNDGTPQAPAFTYAGQISLPGFVAWSLAHLALSDMDCDLDLDLFVSDLVANPDHPDVAVRLFYYRNDGTPQVPRWTFVTSDFQDIILNHRQGGVSVCPVDIEGDGDFDLAFSACYGLQLYLNPLYEVAIGEEETRPSEINISLSAYPNPFNSTTTITLSGMAEAEIAIYDITGRRLALLQAQDGRAEWEASALSSGVYFARVVGEEKGGRALRLVLLK